MGSAQGFLQAGRGGEVDKTLSFGLGLRPEHPGKPFAKTESACAFE